MKKKKIAIIGVGGRTGTMFAFELRNSAEILGIGRKKEIKMIKQGRLFIKKRRGEVKQFEGKIIKDAQFEGKINPDIIFLMTKNPVTVPVKYYYQKFKARKREGIPALLISQNGISAIEDAKAALAEIFGKESEKIRLVRIVFFNPVDREELENKIYIKYSLPIQVAIAKVCGSGGIEDINEIFRKSGFEVKDFPSSQAENLEFSKLFLNLIGMAAASRGFSIKQGFKNQEIFKEEIEALKEYIKVVRMIGGKFVNFPHYPIKSMAVLFKWLPITFLSFFRNILAKIISGERGEKPKDLDEIDYYNGGVVNLGKKIGAKTPINEKIQKRVLEKLSL